MNSDDYDCSYCSYCDEGMAHNCPDREAGYSRCYKKSEKRKRKQSSSFFK